MYAPKENPDTSERVSEGTLKFIEQLDLYDQVVYCVLWQPERDFSKACSCDQCRPKIARLMDFEKEIQAKKRLNMNYYFDTCDKVDLCVALATCVNWTRQLLELLQKNLKEESGVPWKLEKTDLLSKLETVEKQLVDKVINLKFLAPPDDVGPSSGRKPDDLELFLRKLGSGYYEYGKTKAKDKAIDIIKKIEDLEKDRYRDKKIAEAHKTSMDPAISKMYIEKQIEFVEKLPVDELQSEFNELIGNMRAKDYCCEVYQKTRTFISQTCCDLIKKREKFWRGAPSLATEGSDHNSNGLNETLDSLLDEVKLFEAKWKDEYAPIFTNYDRSNPKRQATS